MRKISTDKREFLEQLCHQQLDRNRVFVEEIEVEESELDAIQEEMGLLEQEVIQADQSLNMVDHSSDIEPDETCDICWNSAKNFVRCTKIEEDSFELAPGMFL